jgi:hypothetical protein
MDNNNSLSALTAASQKIGALADQVQEVETLQSNKTIVEKRIEENRKKKEEDPLKKSWAFGFIGLGVALIVAPIIYFFLFIFGSILDNVNDSYLFTAIFMLGFLPLIIGLYIACAIVLYFAIALISRAIMKSKHTTEKHIKKCEDLISADTAKLAQINQDIEAKTNVLLGEHSLLPYIPIPYQYSYALRKFSEYFLQGRAKSIQDAANLFEADKKFEAQQMQLNQIHGSIQTSNAINSANAAINAANMAANVATDIFFIANFL